MSLHRLHGQTERCDAAPIAQSSVLRLGLIGKGIQRSKSPAIHEAEATAQGIRCKYELIDVGERDLDAPDLESALCTAERAGFSGVNITLPYKQAVMALLDELSPEARAVGAVNTVRFLASRRLGYNTDTWGFMESFRLEMRGASLASVLLIGAGGAGAAIGFALLELGARELIIVDIDDERPRALATRLEQQFPDRGVRVGKSVAEAAKHVAGLVNATPIGMAAYPGSAVPRTLLRPDLWIADVVYMPLETELLHAAREMGCATLDGARMLVIQAARAFEIFTGRSANIERMLLHFKKLSSD